MKVNYFNQTKLDVKEYEKIINKVFKKEVNEKTMEIIFTTPTEIKQINQQFRNIKQITDVISFPNDEVLDTSIGDIFINLEQAFLQAKEYEHSVEREVAFLAVHGYLHLLGYDHDTKENEKEMFDLQEEILIKAGLERKKSNE